MSDYREQVARALAEKFTPDYQSNPKFDRKRERAWFDAGNADEEPANSEYMPMPMSERVRLDLMVTFTAADGHLSIRPARIREAVEVIAAVRDAELERLRAIMSLSSTDQQYYPGTPAHAVMTELEQLRAEYAVAHEAVCTIPGYQRDIERLRAELTGLRAEHAQMLADAQGNDEAHLADATAVAEENGRLRAELATIDRGKVDAITDAVASWQQRVVSLKAELAGLRERAVLLPEDWSGCIRDCVNQPTANRLVALIESWRPSESAPSGWPCKCGTDEEGRIVGGRNGYDELADRIEQGDGK
jgi:hypothetical protein